MTGEVLKSEIGPHGLEVLTVAGTDYRRPQVTVVAGVAGTDDAAQIAARLADLESFVMREPRRSARDDRRT